jgi:hypothetical protein
MFKRMIVLVFAGALLFSAMGGALVVVRIAPPRAVIEHRDQRPSHDHVWVSGYHRYENNAYVWTPGEWLLPPRPHDRWIAHRWTHRKDGWVFVEGHWRS